MKTFNESIQDMLGIDREVLEAYLDSSPIELNQREINDAVTEAQNIWNVYIEYTPSNKIDKTLQNFIDEAIERVKKSKEDSFIRTVLKGGL